MTINNSISKYDWQYILSASLLISVFILTDLIGVIDKEYFYFVPKLISDQPYRIFTSILIHADLNHLLSNIGGIIITRYFLMRLGIESRYFYVKFILICSFLNFFIIWFYEKILSFFNIYPNYAALGFSGIIYALFGFLLLTSFYGKSNFLGKKIGLKSNYEVQKMSKTICLIGLIFSFLPGVSLLGHLSGFIAGCFLFLI
ncbi:rhomboid family intramembrane serine protease [Prochlorococcus marinus str. XMU1401]|uniref:Rhomboid family intramembrane serine protease n=1 Tax=Prochlorococcus marinus str. XMU1401 TaxID=2052594 RepID=A0A8I2BKF5_PROMR|nr:rhomboid family intramembrane serine protease [Prochlorococcus marinus]MBO8223221.1 rhomboid family intramembrane serine protease [Prochlorococcus marinus str. XMU1401]MBW3059754.1 rhomboid family intramembrane serine protease [Prochlorococcus marinus str. XMU1401E]MCQ9199022.1 rhomboid family intramembrane serine protease [Prochlorococcus marinus XMU1429]PJC83571.1 rhomboid family intramembrane serine protease [Prochlorococcus marinus str. XMU1401]